MRFAIRSTLRAFLVLGGLVGGVSAVARAQQGTVAGRVTDQANGQPLVGARVTVMGTSLIAQTNAEGRFTLSRVPGGQITVRASAVAYGAPSRVRIRGTNSLSLTNEPVYFVDGIRVTSQNRSSGVCDVGCAPPSRINDLNPEDFESVEVVKGPAASALYGTDAANGVVVIKTKHGQPGKARWNVYAEQGAIKDYNDYPDAFRGWRTGTTAATTSTPTNTVQCILTQVAAGTCVQDSVTQFNLFQDPKTTPLGTGHRQQYGVQVSGGSDAVRYYMSGEWEDEVGQTKMPLFADSILRALRQISELPGDQAHPNALRRTSVRANLSTNPNARMDPQGATVLI